MFSVLITAVAAVSAIQQAGQAATPGEIVVTGRAPIGHDAALRTVTDITMVSSGLQIARFHAPVCPAVAGLSAEAAGTIEERIRTVARQAGAKVADRGCDANLMIFFSDDGRQLVGDMRTKRPKWFAGLSEAKIDLIERGDGPVRAWSATSIRNEDGDNAQNFVDGGAPAAMKVKGASFLERQTRLYIDASMIVIDRSAAQGRALDEIADYAAMRGLAMTKSPEQGGVDTILSLFASPGRGSPRSLSAFDLGYLTALYRGSGGESAVEERNRIARAISS